MADNVGNLDGTNFDNFGGDGMIPDPPPRRGPGRPPKANFANHGISEPYTGKPGKSGQRQEPIDESEPLTDDMGIMLPLFNSPMKKSVLSLRVIRIEPNEGYIGTLDNPHATEADIQERWGGGTYRIQALGEGGAILRINAMKIAGDPIFQSRSLKAQWERMHGVKEPAPSPMQFPQAAPGGGLDIKEILMFMSEKENMRAESESRLAERQRQLQIEADDRRRKDEWERETRRKQDEEERERRQAQQRRDDTERDRENSRQTMALIQASHAQSMQFMQAQMQMQQSKPGGESALLEAIKTIAVIKDTFGAGDAGGGGGDAEETVMQSLIKNGPAWLNAAGTAITGVVGEIKNGPNNQNQQNPGQPQSILNNLPLEIQSKTEKLVLKLIDKGLDPEAELNKVLDTVLVAAEKLPTPGQNQPVQIPQPRKPKPVDQRSADPKPQTTQEPTQAATPEPATQQDISPTVVNTAQVEPQEAKVIPINKPKNKLIVQEKTAGVASVKFAPKG